jgi:type I restriction-modification system DNA methylase subunit
MPFIDEMLDSLDVYYIEQNSISIFSDSRLKWFDPAVGMGNFIIAVYLRLMDGLEIEIPNIKRRKRHILENMLYMSELNKKNVFICQQIFNGSGKYKLNLYEGDTLELDVESEFKVELNGFDVVLGNPPYNKGGIWSHTKKMNSTKREVVWMKFVEKSFDLLKPEGYLLFITPLYWLKINNEIHNSMLEKHIMWLKLWDN